jgi:hypothetical protein
MKDLSVFKGLQLGWDGLDCPFYVFVELLPSMIIRTPKDEVKFLSAEFGCLLAQLVKGYLQPETM